MNRLVAAVVALVAFGTIAYAVSLAGPWQEQRDGYTEDLEALAQDLFTDHVVAFEVLGVLLTAAMIGALVIARPLTGVLDKSHYPKPTDADFERTQAVSDVNATYAPPARVSDLLAQDALAAGTVGTAGVAGVAGARAGRETGPVVTDDAPEEEE